MAGKKKAKTLLPSEVLEKLWDAIDWYTLAVGARPQSAFHRKGPHVQGYCIYHDETGGSFSITPNKRIAYCFGCHRFIGNPINLTADLLRCTYVEAIAHLKQDPRTRKLLPKAFVEQSEAQDTHQRYKQLAVEFCCNQLMQLVAMTPAEVAQTAPWALETIEMLHERIPVDNSLPTIAANHHFGILPPLNIFENDPEFSKDEKAVKFAVEYFKEHIIEKHEHVGALMLISHTDPSTVERVKLRKKSWFDPKTIFVKDAFAEPDSTGFFGLRFYREFFGSKDNSIAKTVYMLEGEFDSAHSMAHHTATGYDYVALAAGGGSAQSLDKLADLGVKTVNIIPDADNGGVGFTQILLSKSYAKDLAIRIFHWPDKYLRWRDPVNPTLRIKDVDEVLQKVGYSTIAKDLLDPANFREPHEWALDQLERALGTQSEPSLHDRTVQAAQLGKYLHHPQECRQFCRDVAERYGLDETILHSSITAANEDELGFIQRIRDALVDRYNVLGYEVQSSKLLLWDPIYKVKVDLPIDKKQTVLAKLTHGIGPVTTFIQEKVGEPTFLVDEESPGSININIRQTRYENDLMIALGDVVHNARLLDDTISMRQGFHYKADKQRGYIANGSDLWRLNWDDDQFAIERLLVPCDDDVTFDLNATDRWLKLEKDEEVTDLKLDLREMHGEVLAMLQAWSFKYQHVDPNFLAAYIMSLPVADIFERQTSIAFSGNAGSGKSSLIAGLIGGKNFPKIRLVSSSSLFSSVTAAGLRQATNGATLTVCVDEFENDRSGDSRSRSVSSIAKSALDPMTSHTGGTTVIGTVNGKGHKYSQHYPFIFAFINPTLDEATLSRLIMFDMALPKKGQQHPDPKRVLLSRWGEERISQLRYQLGLGMFRYVPQLREAYSTISKELAETDTLGNFVPMRFRETLLSILAVQKLVGVDYRQFAIDFCNSRAEHISRAQGAGMSASIFDDLLDAQIEIRDERRTLTTVRRLLANVGDLDLINRQGIGIYYDVTKRWLLVNWVQALTNSLRTFPAYRDRTPKDIANFAERAPQHVPSEEVDKYGVFKRMADHIGFGIRRENWSVFNVGPLVEQAVVEDSARRTAETPKDKEKEKEKEKQKDGTGPALGEDDGDVESGKGGEGV